MPGEPDALVVFDGLCNLCSATVRTIVALPAPWPAMRVLALIPRPLRDAAYDAVARNRYRLFGRRASCLRPDAALAARFVEDVPPT